jgi:hypothetical protein
MSDLHADSERPGGRTAHPGRSENGRARTGATSRGALSRIAVAGALVVGVGLLLTL